MESKSFFCVAQLVWFFGPIIFSPGVDLTVWWCWMKLKRLMPRRHELVEPFFFSLSFGSKKRGQTTLGYSEIYSCNKKSWKSMWTNQYEWYGIQSVFHGLPVKSKKQRTKTTRVVWVPKPKGYLTTMSWTCRSDSGARNDIIPFTQKQNSLKILEITG